MAAPSRAIVPLAGLVLAGALGYGLVRTAAPYLPFLSGVRPSAVIRLDSLRTFARTPDSTSVRVFAGSPTVLFVFQEECAHCRTQTSSWLKLTSEVTRTFSVQAVSIDPVAEPEAYPLLQGGIVTYLGAARPAWFPRELRMQAVPFTAVIDAEGIVVGRHQGVATIEELRRLIANVSAH
jgi:hypothetical protein